MHSRSSIVFASFATTLIIFLATFLASPGSSQEAGRTVIPAGAQCQVSGETPVPLPYPMEVGLGAA